MKKHFLFLAVLTAFLLASCKEKEEAPIAELTVSVSCQEDCYGKGPNESLDTINYINSVTLLFFRHDDHSKVIDTTQLRADCGNNFDDFHVRLPEGSYDMVVMAYGRLIPIVTTSYTLASIDGPTTVFHTLQTVTVTSSGPNTINATLTRVNSCLVLTATDSITANAEKVRIHYSSSSGTQLNPSEALAVGTNGFYVTSGSLANAVGVVNRAFTSNIMLNSDEQVMDVVITVLDASDNVLITHSVPNVSFKRNRRTTLRGPVFHQTSQSGFTVNTDWLTEHDGGEFE